MRIGYARTSTSNQKYSLENQIDKLTKNGCEKIFSEEISSLSAKRPAFNSAIEFARDGDILVVTTLSRFARSISDLWKHVEELDEKGVSFQILDMNSLFLTHLHSFQVKPFQLIYRCSCIASQVINIHFTTTFIKSCLQRIMTK